MIELNRKFRHVLKASLLTAGLFLFAPVGASDKPGTFGVENKTFLLNGKPFIIKAAEVHYPRIPRPYWEHRIKMCKALGMNTLCLYVFWNIHEPEEGKFDFTGNNDVAAFCRLAQENGMYVIVRPGPYVCAEWEMGGLPWWLLKKKDIRLREQDPYFMERVRIFEKEVGKQLAPLTIQNGGPIIMVQVENEYGSYGIDKPYVSAIRDIVKESGFDKVTLFQCDWASNFTNNGLDDLVWTMNFGTGANIDSQFEKLGELRPDSPKMCSEFWSGWFDKWGARHETRPAKEMVEGIDEMLSKDISFSLYMTHGGTSFGHWAGANSPGFDPDVTSYDYDAPISEQGVATPKYYELRQVMEKYAGGKKLPDVPKAIATMSFPKIRLTEYAPLGYGEQTAKDNRDVLTFEDMDMGWGTMVYQTQLPEIPNKSVLTLNEGHDFSQIDINGEYVGKIDRVKHEKFLTLPAVKKGDMLTIVVEAMGRINFGRAIKDYKGITSDVKIKTEQDGDELTWNLKDWTMRTLPDDYQTALKAFDRKTQGAKMELALNSKSGYYRGYFDIKRPADTFIDMETWGKGQVYVNGHAIGRFWSIGPQQTLYMPGCWLKKGKNEIIVLDVVGPQETTVEGLSSPILDKLNIEGPNTHRKAGQNLDLTGETPCKTGEFAAGNGWQEVLFDQPVSGRYVCIEAWDSHSGNEYACIAEWYMLDADGQRINREPWTVVYADDEDISSGNKTADKIFDLQESTYWSTNKGVAFPHYIVLDLGSVQNLGGFQYLPRAEQGAPESIKTYKIYVKSTPFKF